jgi:hypothetical protein
VARRSTYVQVALTGCEKLDFPYRRDQLRWHAGIRIAHRMRKMATSLPARPRRVKDAPCPRQGRSEVHGAKKNERHICGRA